MTIAPLGERFLKWVDPYKLLKGESYTAPFIKDNFWFPHFSSDKDLSPLKSLKLNELSIHQRRLKRKSSLLYERHYNLPPLFDADIFDNLFLHALDRHGLSRIDAYFAYLKENDMFHYFINHPTLYFQWLDTISTCGQLEVWFSSVLPLFEENQLPSSPEKAHAWRDAAIACLISCCHQHRIPCDEWLFDLVGINRGFPKSKVALLHFSAESERQVLPAVLFDRYAFPSLHINDLYNHVLLENALRVSRFKWPSSQLVDLPHFMLISRSLKQHPRALEHFCRSHFPLYATSHHFLLCLMQLYDYEPSIELLDLYLDEYADHSSFDLFFQVLTINSK
mmetsp:Transcript_7006/g.10286  ORF Transcript_7006/g.10286 Transcript_7006/m.10286 type:complete len:336 (-) Transcript_7006:1726-2733(-)